MTTHIERLLMTHGLALEGISAAQVAALKGQKAEGRG